MSKQREKMNINKSKEYKCVICAVKKEFEVPAKCYHCHKAYWESMDKNSNNN